MENTIVVGTQDPILKQSNTSGVDHLMSLYPNSGYYQPQMQTKPNYNPTVGNGGNAATYPIYQPSDTRPENTQNNLLGSVGQNLANGLNGLVSLLGQNMGNGSYGTSGTSGSSILSGLLGGLGGAGRGYSNYITQMYDTALNAQLESLKNIYEQNLSDLDASKAELDNAYTEEKRQAVGNSARDAAAWRELANAYGLNSGAIGQAALARNNQIQSDLNTLATAQTAALAEMERQRVMLGKEYQAQISQAIAESNFEKANALYQEAVRMDEKMKKSFGGGGGGYSTYYGSPKTSSLTSSYVTTTTDDTAKKSSDETGDTPAPDIEENPSEKMTEEEFNGFWRGLKEYVSAGQQERLNKLIEENADRLTEEQYEKVKEQLSKLKPNITKPGSVTPGNRLRQELR